MPQLEARPRDDARFAFGENWREFLAVVDERRIASAQAAMAGMLGLARLDGLGFLDVGSGSGLSSLVATRMGADRVHSFDYDEGSVACTRELKRRFIPEAEHWTVERGDATDPAYVHALGPWDVVLSWGVLHHTGSMWPALDTVCGAVADGGRLFIAIYNDQGWRSRAWRVVKKAYVEGSPARRRVLVEACAVLFGLRSVAGAIAAGDSDALRAALSGRRGRGMSARHDVVDWVGGYPFEVARPEEVLSFCRRRGLELVALDTVGGRLGCNQYVFRRHGGEDPM